MYKQPVVRLILIAVLCLGSQGGPALGTPLPPSSGAVTLLECYQKAQQMSETLRISDQDIQRIQSQYHSALGSVFPHLYWIKSQEYQDTSATASGDGTVSRSLTRSPIPLSYFQLQQPIFAGGKDWQAVRIAKSAESQARFNRQQADLQLLADVATAFYTASSLGNQLTVLGGLHKLTEDRIKELNHFVDVGRSRHAEVLSAQTQLASLEAQIEDLKRAYAQSRHTLLFFTGVPVDVPLNDTSLAAPSRSLDEALLRAGGRPDIQATMETLKQADLYIRYAKGGFWPKLSLIANSYTERTHRSADAVPAETRCRTAGSYGV